MAHDEEQLAPETIEEQLDYLAQALHFMPPDASKTPNMQVVEALQGVYEEERQTDADSLDRVWNRLAPRTLQQHQAAPVRRLRETHERRSRMKSIFLPRREGMISRLGVIAAVMLLVILVGSVSAELILHQKHPNSGATVVPIQGTPTSTPVPQPMKLGTIYMLDETTGWATTAQNQLLHTNNGGTLWQNVTPPGLGSGQPVADFLDASHAWVAAIMPSSSSSAQDSVTLLRTSDGGHTWQQAGTLTPHFPVAELVFINAQDGWILDKQGAAGNEVAELFRSTDGGASWTVVATTGNPPTQPGPIPFNGTVKRISFLNASTGWMTALFDQTNDVWLYVTHDGGATWHHQSLPLPSGVTISQAVPNPPTFFDSQNGSMLVDFEQSGFDPGAYYLYATHDGGANWQLTTRLPVDPINLIDPSPDFITANQGWTSDGSTLYVTSDGGQRWTKLQANSTFNYILELNFVSRAVGWAISFPPTSIGAESTLNGAAGAASRPTNTGHSGTLTLIKTVDGGQTWQTVTPMLV